MKGTITPKTQTQETCCKQPTSLLIRLVQKLSLSSTCCSKQVGAVIYNYKTGTPLSIGVNKSIIIDCDRLFNKKEHTIRKDAKHFIDMTIKYERNKAWTQVDVDTFEKAHDQFVERYEVHAEMNALNNLSTAHKKKDLALLCTHQPCINCLKHIVNAGIEHVFFINEYKKVSKCQIKTITDLNGITYENIQSK